MIFLCLLCAALAFLLFALAMDDHHKKWLGGKASAETKRRLRTGAWAGLALAFPLGIAARGWIFGPVLWFAAIMAGAGIVFLTLNLLPGRRTPAAKGARAHKAP